MMDRASLFGKLQILHAICSLYTSSTIIFPALSANSTPMYFCTQRRKSFLELASIANSQTEIVGSSATSPSMVTVEEEDLSEMDASMADTLLEKGQVGISEVSKRFSTCESRSSTLTSISAVSSITEQVSITPKPRKTSLSRFLEKRLTRKQISFAKKSTSAEDACDETLLSGNLKPELSKVVGETQLEASLSTDENDLPEVDEFFENSKTIARSLSLFHPLKPPAMITQFAAFLDAQPLSLDIHSPVEPDFPSDGMITGDALSYCALFPPNYEFEKDTLLQLWIAEGVVVQEPMERIACVFFENCLTKGYFQFSRINLVTGNSLYKFKGESHLMPLLMRLRGSSHIVRIEGKSDNLSDQISSNISHVSIRCDNLKDFIAFSNAIKRFKHLKTLVFLNGCKSSFKQVPRDFFLSLRLLRVLDFSQTHLVELPTSIGNMKCLRYLDLSDTPIKCLPEAIDGLENLQTLKLRGCLHLSTLPRGMRKLVNLRHLDFDVLRQLGSMPQGMGALINIQTLSAFLVGGEEGCSIRQLKNMNKLSGSFLISRLENVLTKDEVEEACVSNKSELKQLELHWSNLQDEDVVRCTEVLSSLRPNASLVELRISGYGGFELPSWISDPTFSKLVSITVFDCENCSALPSFGELPSLKYLNLFNFHKLKVIDHNFYGGLGIQGFISFPKLEKLVLEDMFGLEEWNDTGKFDFPCLLTLTVKHCPKLYNICTFSWLHSLKNLEISHCAMLASWTDGRLPTSLETFIIEDCPLVNASFFKDGVHDWEKVAHVQNVWVDHQEISLGERSLQGK